MIRRASTALIGFGVALTLIAVVAGVFVLRSNGPDGMAAQSAVIPSDPHALTDQLIAFYQARIERDPVDFVSYAGLGSAYTRQARETGDISAYTRAETALRKALEIQPDDPDAKSGLASVLFATHDFAGALSLATELYAADPGATQALATIGDANFALGNYADARGAYAKLSEVAHGASVLSRQSQLDELDGNLDRAIELMKQADEASSAKPRSAETLAFYRQQLGNLSFTAGRYDDAGRWYRAALSGFTDYYPALAGLGNVAAARGDYEQAIDYYQESVAIVPQPVVLAALGDAYARAGDGKSAQRQYATVEFIGKLAQINRTVYNRELALFYADHLIKTSTAVELAMAELQKRKDVYGYDTLAWALYRDGRAGEAAPLMAQALARGTRDARLFFHAGLIAHATGAQSQARDYLASALDLNPHFSVLLEQEARQVLAQLDGERNVEAEQ